MDLAEQQIREGSATAQVITHFLKLGTEREKLEREKLRGDNELTKAKIESLAAAGRIEKLYDEAMVAMRSYQGHRVPDEPLD
jgi:ribulose kinase